MENFNRLTPAEAERLALIAEEAAEVIQAVTKILRHGYLSEHPDNTDPARNNKADLEKEIGDFYGAVGIAVGCFDLDPHNIEAARKAKPAQAMRYFHHNPHIAASS